MTGESDLLSPSARAQLVRAASSFKYFCIYVLGIKMHPYQLTAAEAIIKSVLDRDGHTIVIIFSRQSGKDELLACVLLYLLARFVDENASMVCCQPTYKPQTINAMERLMTRAYVLGRMMRRTAGYIVRFHSSKICYFSADPTASVVGATADRLLVVNEAQDVDPDIYDKRFSPMCASGNATRVISGTAWTNDTLLERERKIAEEAQARDGIRRVFIVNSTQVARSNPRYGTFVRSEVKRMGRNHPLIRSQYFNELIDAETSLFNPGRLALMRADLSYNPAPQIGINYAFLIDVAGQDESVLVMDDAPLNNPARDSTSLTIVSVDPSSIPTLQAPTYRVVYRQQWIGVSHVDLFGALRSLVGSWSPQYIAIDATGVGEGLYAMLYKQYPLKTIPVKFTQLEKSEIGWRFLSIIETGRFRDCAPSDDVLAQYVHCRSEILPGPGKVMRWSVPDGARNSAGDLIHDDYLMADALVAVLDRLEWTTDLKTAIINSPDPLLELGKAY